MSESMKVVVAGFIDECTVVRPEPDSDQTFGVAVGTPFTLYPGHEPRYTEAEWREKQREQRPDAEVIERARQMRDYAFRRGADPGPKTWTSIDEWQRFGETIDTILAYVEAAPEAAPYVDETLMLETALTEADVAALHEWMAAQRADARTPLPGDLPALMERVQTNRRRIEGYDPVHAEAAVNVKPVDLCCVIGVLRDMESYLSAVDWSDARTPVPPGLLAELEEAAFVELPTSAPTNFFAEAVECQDAIRAALPHLRADEVVTREAWDAALDAATARVADAWGVRKAEVSVRVATHGQNNYVAMLRKPDGTVIEQVYASQSRGRIAALEALADAAPCPCADAEWRNAGWQWRNIHGAFWLEDACHHRVLPGDPCPDCQREMPPAPPPDPEEMYESELDAELEAADVSLCVSGDADALLIYRAAVRALREQQAQEDETDE